MNNLQKRKALQRKVLSWAKDKWLHHRKCEFAISWDGKCNCNYALDNN